MAQTKSEYYSDAQITERKCIKLLFEKFFKPHNCHRLTLTSTDDDPEYPSSFDFHMFSAITTNIVGEFKRRNICSWTKSDVMLECKKYRPLQDYHHASNTVLFVVHFDDVISIWNLSRMYNNEQHIELDHYFYLQDCTRSMYNYSNGEEEKLIRDLKFVDCDFILDAQTYKELKYKE